MVKSRSSTSIFRSTFASSSIISDLSGYDTDSVITFRPPAAPSSPSSASKRPAPLHLTNSHKSSNRSSSRASQASSLPVTPGTPPSTFPFDPFSHPTTLPEPTRSRPASLAHSFERSGGGKTPEIVIASPSTSTIHYLFPSVPSSTGNHLSTGDRAATVGRHGSQRRKGSHPADAFSASTRNDKDYRGRTSRLGSDPVVGIKASQTFDSDSMRTLRRQPSLADLGSRGRAVAKVGKENVQPMTLAGVVEEKKNKALGLRVSITANPFDPKPTSPILSKANISEPVLLSPRSTNPRRRSLSLSSPRPAPSVPSPSLPSSTFGLQSPPSPVLPSPNFGRPLGIEVGDVISSSTSYTHLEASTGPFSFPGGVPMSRGTTKVGCGPVDDGKLTARLDAERRMKAAGSRMSIIPEAPSSDTGHPLERRLSLTGRVRRSLSLKITSETKSIRRRSQSVSARGEKHFDTSVPLPLPLPYPVSHDFGLGLGDPSVDMGDRYGLAKIIPSSYSHSAGLGLDVRIDEIGQRSPQRKRIDLGGSNISLLASSASMSTVSRGRGLGFSSGSQMGSGSPMDSPMSLPESLMEEAVDLTERRRIVGGSSDGGSGVYGSRSGSETSVDRTYIPAGGLSARPTPVLSNTSTPYLQFQSQMTSPNFPSPIPQTPHFDSTSSAPSSPAGLGSPAIINSPLAPSSTGQASPIAPGEDHTTRYAVSSRKPNLRYSKSFTSDVGGKVARSFSWRTKASAHTQMKRYVPDTETAPTPEEDSSVKKDRISRSFSFATRTRSPMPIEMRQISNPIPVQGTGSMMGAAPLRPIRVAPAPSTGDISAPRWRPPTLYSLCSPDGAVDPLPTPPRKPYPAGVTQEHIPDIILSPIAPVTLPSTPNMGRLGVETDTYRNFSSSTTTSTAPTLSVSGTAKSASPFLSASSSFRGLTKTLSKSFSRTFDRHYHASDSVRQADSALKARISSPLEATRELEQQALAARERSLAHINLNVGINSVSVPTSVMEGKKATVRGGSKEWRESILTQVVSASIKDGLCEYGNQSHYRPSESTERTSWSKSVGRTFGLKSSSSASTGIMSRDSLAGSFPRRLSPKSAETPSRALKDIGKQESNISIYSTASCLPMAQGQRITHGPPIHISHYSPPKQIPVPTPTIINFSHPRPPLVTSPTLDTLSSSPPFLDLAHFPSVPISSHAIYRPTTPPSPSARCASAAGSQDGEYTAQPLLSRLSTLPGNQAQVQGKEERVKKVLRWRREIGSEEGVAEGSDVGSMLGEVGSGMEDETSVQSVEGEEVEDERLDGMIARHVEGEKERLRGIVRRRSIDEGLEAGLGF